VLEDDERELGCAVLDIGGGTTDLIVFIEDNVRHTASIGLGGRNVTNDLAIGIRTPLERAEEIKRTYGTCLRSGLEGGEYIPVPGVGGRDQREVSRAVLASIIEPRMREIFTLALRELQKNHYLDMIGAGVVLTGGCSLLHGVTELAEQVFGMPVKIGVPKGFGGLVDSVASPVHATGVGLVHYGVQRQALGHGDTDLSGGGDRFRDMWKKLAGWVKQYV
jgi:cell division protein FtsA